MTAVASISVGPMDNNAYLLTCEQTGEKLLIDAAAQVDRLLDFAGAEVATVVTTHQHFDHHGALAEFVAATGATTVAGEPDADELPIPVDRRVWTGDTIALGDATLEVIGIVGHTPGSIVLVLRNPEEPVQLFTGDSLFPGGVGKTWSEEDFDSLIDDVESKIFGAFDDDTVFWPGHGKPSTLGAERPHLAEWRERRY